MDELLVLSLVRMNETEGLTLLCLLVTIVLLLLIIEKLVDFNSLTALESVDCKLFLTIQSQKASISLFN